MADGGDEEENWPEFFENNRLIPVHPNRRKSGSQSKPNVPFRLLFKSVVGVSIPQSLVSTAGYFCYFSCYYCSPVYERRFYHISLLLNILSMRNCMNLLFTKENQSHLCIMKTNRNIITYREG